MPKKKGKKDTAAQGEAAASGGLLSNLWGGKSAKEPRVEEDPPAAAEPVSEAEPAPAASAAPAATATPASPASKSFETAPATPGTCQVCKSTSSVILIEQQTIASGMITVPGTFLCQTCIEDQPQSTDWKVWQNWRNRKGA